MSEDQGSDTAEVVRLTTAPVRAPYRHPVLVPLGSLRDMTLTINTPKGRLDGSKTRRTGRGGRFDAAGGAN